MSRTRRVRKQCSELTAEDFERFPCWEFALDEEGRRGQDEATVRPVELDDNSGGQKIVLGVFSFPNGRVRLGHLTVGYGTDVSDIHPALFTESGLLLFYRGALQLTKAESRRELLLLRAICERPFPVYYSTTLHDKGGQPLASGVLKGFYKYGGFDRPAKKLAAA